MDIFTDSLVNFEESKRRAIEEEAAVRQQYCMDLLKKHMLDPDQHKFEMTDAVNFNHYLEKLGYRVERHVISTKDNSELYEWKLFKQIDTSPKYRIKRVVSVEEAKQNLSEEEL